MLWKETDRRGGGHAVDTDRADSRVELRQEIAQKR
jgi:hypothetical protein